MKKVFLLLILIISCFNFFGQDSDFQNTNADDGITGFYGISFGTNKEDLINIMKEKGWKINMQGTDKNLGEYVAFYSGTYASKKISNNAQLAFYFYNDEYYLSDLTFGIKLSSKTKDDDYTWVKNVINGIVIKYNLSQIESSNNSVTYEGNNKNQLILKTRTSSYFTWCDICSVDFERSTKKILLKTINDADGVINSDDL